MKNIILLATFCSIGILTYGQNAKIDSLMNILKNTKENNTRINTLNSIAYEYRNNDPDSSVYFSNEALGLATILNDKIGIATAYLWKGYAIMNLGKNEDALKNYFEALKIFMKLLRSEKRIDNVKILNLIARTYNNIGIVYFNQSNYSLSLINYSASLKIFKEINDIKGIAISYNNFGGVYHSQGDFLKAIDYYLKALHLQEEIGDKNGVAADFGNIGFVYYDQGDYIKALEYYYKALKMDEELLNKYGIVRHLGNIGLVYFNQGEKYIKQSDTIQAKINYIKSLEYYFKALKIDEEIGYKIGIARHLGNIGLVYVSQGDLLKNQNKISNSILEYQKAFKYYFLAVKMEEEIDDKGGIGIWYRYIGSLYTKKGEYQTAERYLKKSLKIAKEINSLDDIKSGYETLSDLYTQSENYKEALSHYIKATEIKDSLLNEKKIKEFTRLEMQYDFDKKEASTKADTDKKEALAKAEIGKQKIIRNSIAGGTGILVISAAFSFLFYKRKREATFKNEVSEVEMKALRAQMNPHFIFNSLNSINSYLEKNDNKTASHYLLDFASVMRMILENSEQKEVTLQEDLKALELYMKLESMRMTRKFDYEIKVDESIDAENTMIPPLILQPFVENSIWHGLANKKEAGKIIINITKNGDMMECSVEDNGIGREKSDSIKAQYAIPGKKSLGMKITKARIDILNKIKKSKAGIELIDLTEGMRVVVRLPLELSF